MPKRIAALAVVLVLTLTGCAGVPTEGGDERTAPAPTPSATTATPSAASTATAAPATVPPVEPEPENSTAERDGQIQDSAYIETYLADEGYTLTPEEVLGVGNAIGPGSASEVADDGLVGDRPEQRGGVFRPAGPQ